MGRDERIAIGHVLRPHGLTGEVAVEVWTDFPERFTAGLAVELRSDSGEVRLARIESVRPHGGRVLVRFAGVSDLRQAEELRDLDLCVTRSETPARPDGFVFHHEVAGCAAVDGAGRSLGTVVDLVEVGGRHLLAVETPRGRRDVPFAHPIVVRVDLAERRIVLDPPPGLLD